MAGTHMKSLQIQEVSVAAGEMLGDVDKQVKVSDVLDKQVHHSGQEGDKVHHSGQEGDEVHHSGDVDEHRHLWDAIDENKQIWEAIDEERKLKTLEEKRKKQHERSQKKKKMVPEAKRKELKKRRMKPSEIQELKMMKGRGSPSATYLSQRVTSSPFVRSPLTRSPRLKMLGSSLRVLAEVAASKRERSTSTRAESSSYNVIPEVAASKRRRSPSTRDESSSPDKRAKPSTRSPSMSRSPSPTSSPSPISSPVGSPSKTTRGRKTRRLTSKVWKDFKPIYHHAKLVKAQCNHCDEILPAGRVVGTSGVRRHLDTCKTRSDLHLIVQKLKSSVESPHASALKNWEFDQKVSRNLLARMIVLDEMPFSIVEYSGFIDFVRSLNPLFDMVSRVTIRDDCMQAYYDRRSFYREGFKKYSGRVSLTSDMWTSNQTLGYICITCHFIDMKWKLQKKIIRFCMLETPHNGVAMFNVLLKSLQDWNIEDKLFSITVDNASVNGVMVNNLRENLVSKNMLHYEGGLLHIRCACHVLNLIVQDGLVALKSVVDNIRESVKYVKSSQSRLDKFKEVVTRVGISCKFPSIDVSTRWNSTYLMLESAFPFRKAFHTLGKEDTSYKFCPSSSEWRRAGLVCSMLKVFHKATQVVSGSTYPTSNLYFHEIWNVKVLLEKEASTKDEVIRSMLKAMQEKFNKYWLESYLANSIAVILDPRFKYGFIEFRLEQAFGSDCAEHLVKVKTALDGLFEEYSSQMSLSTNDTAQGENIHEVVMEETNPLADWDQHLSMKQRQPKNELDRYLQEETFPRKDDFDILQWWGLHSSKYPVLARIARDVLAVPASVVPSESAFSTGQRVISDYRSRLDSTTVEALICLQDWFKRFDSLADIVKDDGL